MTDIELEAERNCRDYRITETEYVVNATREEVTAIWHRWCDVFGINLIQDYSGFHGQIGTIADRPICVSVQWYVVAGLRIAFVDGVSQLVDYVMIEKWERETFPCMSRPDAWIRHTNAGNFHNIILDIQRRIGHRLPQRDYKETMAAIQRVPVRP